MKLDAPIDPVRLLQDLISFDTTNPPGNESVCIDYVRDLLTKTGIESTIYESQPGRANLLARIKGRGEASPLLLYGHVDVVTTEDQTWTHPPFEARIADGFVWGRGALDMKSGVAMMLAAFLEAAAEIPPPGDVVLAVLADEENGGIHGAKFLVDSHPDLFDGIRYALGEVGGATTHLGGRRFYPIQIAEKQLCWMKTSIRGPGGHGAQPMRGGAMARLGRFLTDLDRQPLPIHITPVTERMINLMADSLENEVEANLRALLDPDRTAVALGELGQLGRFFEPLLRNMVNATIVRGGSKVNVIPSQVTVELDGRLLPGFTPDDMIAEIKEIAGTDLDIQVLHYEPTPAAPDLGIFDLLAGILADADPGSVPVPLLLAGVTDGRHFAKLGIQTYGFMPLKLPPDFDRLPLIHAADERVPTDALTFGVRAIAEAIYRSR